MKSPDVLIVGQGIAGTLVAWELERVGISFVIASDGRPAASAAAAGIVNPITGRRLVKSWRVETLLPLARETYAGIERSLDVKLWHDMRVRRLFADDGERAAFATKQRSGELAPFAGAADDDGFWIEGAGRVDLPQLLSGSRKNFSETGRYRAEVVASLARERDRYAWVIDCRGLAGARAVEFAFVPWEFSKGEVLELAVDGLAPDVILNRRHWVVPVAAGAAWVGATHEPGNVNATPTAAARRSLEESARALAARPFTVCGQRAGVRVNLPDKRPVVGGHPEQTRLGVCNGLGAKGALVAPWLARMWAEHMARGAPFDAEVDVARFRGAELR